MPKAKTVSPLPRRINLIQFALDGPPAAKNVQALRPNNNTIRSPLVFENNYIGNIYPKHVLNNEIYRFRLRENTHLVLNLLPAVFVPSNLSSSSQTYSPELTNSHTHTPPPTAHQYPYFPNTRPPSPYFLAHISTKPPHPSQPSFFRSLQPSLYK